MPSYASGIQIHYFRAPTADEVQDVQVQHDPEEDGYHALYEPTQHVTEDPDDF